jgi:hypothetical protein
MPGNPQEMITMAERRFPVRIRIAVPPGGLDGVLDMAIMEVPLCLEGAPRMRRGERPR